MMNENEETVAAPDPERLKVWESARQSNIAKLTAIQNTLQAQGHKIDTDVMILTARLNLLVECLLSNEDRLEFEILFETRMKQELAEILKQVNQFALTNGVPQAAPGQLILPK